MIASGKRRPNLSKILSSTAKSQNPLSACLLDLLKPLSTNNLV